MLENQVGEFEEYRKDLLFKKRMTSQELCNPTFINVRGIYDTSLRRSGTCVYRGCNRPQTAHAVHPKSGEVVEVGDGSCEACWRSHHIRGKTQRNGRHGGHVSRKGRCELDEQRKSKTVLKKHGFSEVETVSYVDHTVVHPDFPGVIFILEEKVKTFGTRDYGQIDGYVWEELEKRSSNNKVIGVALAPGIDPIAKQQLADAGHLFITQAQLNNGELLTLAKATFAAGHSLVA